MNEPTITIDRKTVLNNVLKYLKENRKRPKKEQTLAYKNLMRICKENGISAEEYEEFFEEMIKNE